MANQGIWQVNADGSNLHLVWSPPPDGSGIDDGPTFTPDGNYIIFTRCCPQDSGYALWRIKADGTGLRKVTTEIVPPGVDGPSDNLPQVSPDGTTIAFHRNIADCGCYIATVNINGGNLRQLTDLSLGRRSRTGRRIRRRSCSRSSPWMALRISRPSTPMAAASPSSLSALPAPVASRPPTRPTGRRSCSTTVHPRVSATCSP